jgi:hypothetical protein
MRMAPSTLSDGGQPVSLGCRYLQTTYPVGERVSVPVHKRDMDALISQMLLNGWVVIDTIHQHGPRWTVVFGCTAR